MDENTYLRTHYENADRLMVKVLWLLLVIAAGMAFWHDTWLEVFLIALPTALVPTVVVLRMSGSLLSRHSIAVALMVFAALQIHQGRGMIEMHFAIFGLLAFLLYYRDWPLIVTAAGVVAVHHLSFNFLQEAGYGVYVFPTTSFSLVLIHAAYVVFESAILIVMACSGRKEVIQTVELHQIASNLAVVDEKVDIRYRQQNATSDFANDFNQFMEAIHAVVSETKSASTTLHSAAESLSENSGTSTEEMQQQKRDADQLVIAIRELSATLESVSQASSSAASEAVAAANQATISARECASVMDNSIANIQNLTEDVDNTTSTISELAEDSEKIGSVLDVIRNIADQTNLLALNAAIEAARAGENGRGFAVVADEVRTLAQRTQESTEEIQSMIESLQSGSHKAVAAMEKSREKAHLSVQQADQSGEALREISAAVNTINQRNREIAEATAKQSQVSDEVSGKLIAVSQLADDTSTYAERTFYASREFTQLARKLRESVSHFEV